MTLENLFVFSSSFFLPIYCSLSLLSSLPLLSLFSLLSSLSHPHNNNKQNHASELVSILLFCSCLSSLFFGWFGDLMHVKNPKHGRLLVALSALVIQIVFTCLLYVDVPVHPDEMGNLNRVFLPFIFIPFFSFFFHNNLLLLKHVFTYADLIEKLISYVQLFFFFLSFR